MLARLRPGWSRPGVVSTGRDVRLAAPRVATMSGLARMVAAPGFTVPEDGFRDTLAPRLRGRV